VGDPPDPRAVEAAARRGIEVAGRARTVRESDLSDFDLIVAMDRENLRELRLRWDSEGSLARLVLLRDFDPEAEEENRDVPDPYYGGPQGFEQVLDIVHRSCTVLLDVLREDQSRET
jgi:protein-tyrosine phosphatase